MLYFPPMTISNYELNLRPPFGSHSKTPGPFIVAGPCSGESRAQVLDLAKTLKESGVVSLFRCGIWKPRTRPNSFEGIGKEGLSWLKEVQDEIKLPVALEVASPKHVEESLKWGIRVLWLGARTVVNPFLVQEIANSLKGHSDITVMVKNPINTDLSLWIGALERFNQVGIQKLVAIHRGFSTMDNSLYRYPPVWRIPIDLKRIFPKLPIFCDPSHIAGKRKFVPEIAQVAINFGFDGLMIETHKTPNLAKSDSAQQLIPEDLFSLIDHLHKKNNLTLSKDAGPIENLRTKIDEIDHQLIALLSQRKKIIKDLGDEKNKQNLTIVQLERLQKMMEERVSQGDHLDLPRKYVEDIFSLIHIESVRIQQEQIGK